MLLKSLALTSLSAVALADVPTNCFVDDLWGDWTFQIGLQGDADTVTNNASYHNLGDVTATYKFNFAEFDKVTNLETGVEGSVTTIYNQGFEFRINEQIWFMNWYFAKGQPAYDCSRTCVGFLQDSLGKRWARVEGSHDTAKSVLRHQSVDYEREPAYQGKYKTDIKHLMDISRKAKGVWTPRAYPSYEEMTHKDMIYRAGANTVPLSYEEQFGKQDVLGKVAKAVEANRAVHQKKALPANVDWRNMNGVNYVSPVDDQGACGSCYSFASMGLLETRIRIETNMTQQPVFSEQEMITCGKDKTYNQGCNGGFAFQNAGKYASSFGVVEESCATYNPVDKTCPDTSNCQRWYAGNDYTYLGGYYGATTNDGGAAMMEELANNGPIAVGFNVLGDFSSYSGGVYVYTGSVSDFNPFVPVNHAVLMVGYGECSAATPDCQGAPDGTPFWIVKNSWSADWGLNGFFLILRGVDEVGIESVPFASNPIPQF